MTQKSVTNGNRNYFRKHAYRPEEVARVLSKYDFLAIPVLDSGDLMVGIVTVDDAMDVMEDEATEDIIKMGGANPSGTLKHLFSSVPKTTELCGCLY